MPRIVTVAFWIGLFELSVTVPLSEPDGEGTRAKLTTVSPPSVTVAGCVWSVYPKLCAVTW